MKLPIQGLVLIFVFFLCSCTTEEERPWVWGPKHSALQIFGQNCQGVEASIFISFTINQEINDTVTIIIPCEGDSIFGQYYSKRLNESDLVIYSGYNLSGIPLQYKMFIVYGMGGALIEEGEIPADSGEFYIDF